MIVLWNVLLLQRDPSACVINRAGWLVWTSGEIFEPGDCLVDRAVACYESDRRGTLISQDRGWGPAQNTDLTGSRLRSGAEHLSHRIAVEVRRGTLISQDRSWGPVRNTDHTGSRLRSGAEHWSHRITAEVRHATLNSLWGGEEEKWLTYNLTTLTWQVGNKCRSFPPALPLQKYTRTFWRKCQSHNFTSTFYFSHCIFTHTLVQKLRHHVPKSWKKMFHSAWL